MQMASVMPLPGVTILSPSYKRFCCVSQFCQNATGEKKILWQLSPKTSFSHSRAGDRRADRPGVFDVEQSVCRLFWLGDWWWNHLDHMLIVWQAVTTWARVRCLLQRNRESWLERAHWRTTPPSAVRSTSSPRRTTWWPEHGERTGLLRLHGDGLTVLACLALTSCSHRD